MSLKSLLSLFSQRPRWQCFSTQQEARKICLGRILPRVLFRLCGPHTVSPAAQAPFPCLLRFPTRYPTVQTFSKNKKKSLTPFGIKLL